MPPHVAVAESVLFCLIKILTLCHCDLNVFVVSSSRWVQLLVLASVMLITSMVSMLVFTEFQLNVVIQCLMSSLTHSLLSVP